MGFRTVVFTDKKDSPASLVTNQTIIADYDDKLALKKFSDSVDVATFEFENIPLETAKYISARTSLYPKTQVLEITQNRILEKKFLNSIGVKTADYLVISDLDGLKKGVAIFKKAILKTATMGYDGKGQFVLRNENEAEKIWPEVKNQKLILEKFCSFDCEISVIVARCAASKLKSKLNLNDCKAEIVAYEPLTNVHKNSILHKSFYPSFVDQKLKNKASKIAKEIAKQIDLVGVMAVEFFVVNDELLVNELAPRPHNSGHFFTDAANTSQFEQLVRAITGMKFGSTKLHSEGYMENLIGEEVIKAEKFLKNPYAKDFQAKVHLYGKLEAQGGRKMGHINWLRSSK
jgi:5-(carboxyamino)imidazole ribonucleotide synthase